MRILILDDDDRRHTAFAKRYKDHEVSHVFTYGQACKALTDQGPWDLVYLDHDLNDYPDKYKSLEGKTKLNGAHVAEFIACLPSTKLPKEVISQSWDPEQAVNIIKALRPLGVKCSLQPFGVVTCSACEGKGHLSDVGGTTCQQCLIGVAREALLKAGLNLS